MDYGGLLINLGKDVGDDFCEGKIMLLVVLVVFCGNDEECVFWKWCMEGESVEDGDFEWVIELLIKYGVIIEIVEWVCIYGDNVLKVLEILFVGVYIDVLVDVVVFCIFCVS